MVDDDTDFKIASMTPKHKKFADDPEAVSITREELEALKAQIAENKKDTADLRGETAETNRRSLQNETRSIIAQYRSLENQKLLKGLVLEYMARKKPSIARPLASPSLLMPRAMAARSTQLNAFFRSSEKIAWVGLRRRCS